MPRAAAIAPDRDLAASHDARNASGIIKSSIRPLSAAALLPGRYQSPRYTSRSTIVFLISAMALAGLRCFGQALAQFRIVWQR